ncbi:MAG: CBS domain-containing protein, partial [Firmicutes bacterium]|nr:CBS domain-containing protein [Bacillota bacterium]
MFVRDFMTKDPIAIPPQASITYTADLMKKHQLKRFPVVDKNKLVGLVTESDIMKSLPSPATSLSKHEINYLTSKI